MRQTRDDSRPLRLTLPAPAKLNLFLHITGRRPDGYHLLQTVFQLLDYGDTLTLEDAKQDADFYRKATLLPTKERESGLSREAIEKALADAGGNREEAARTLGISRATTFRKLKRLDLPKQKAGPGRRPTPRSS